MCMYTCKRAWVRRENLLWKHIMSKHVVLQYIRIFKKMPLLGSNVFTNMRDIPLMCLCDDMYRITIWPTATITWVRRARLFLLPSTWFKLQTRRVCVQKFAIPQYCATWFTRCASFDYFLKSENKSQHRRPPRICTGDGYEKVVTRQNLASFIMNLQTSKDSEKHQELIDSVDVVGLLEKVFLFENLHTRFYMSNGCLHETYTNI